MLRPSSGSKQMYQKYAHSTRGKMAFLMMTTCRINIITEIIKLFFFARKAFVKIA